MAKCILSRTLIDFFEYEGGWDVRWDGEIRGFGLRVYPSGKKSFVLSYRLHGKKKCLVFGEYGTMTLEFARSWARDALTRLKEEGINPKDYKQWSLKSPDFSVFCGHYIKHYARKHKRTWQDDQRRIEEYLLPRFAGMKLSDIHTDDILPMHQQIGQQYPYEANKLVRLLSKIFNCAFEWEVLPRLYSNPAKAIILFDEERREVELNQYTLPKLLYAIDNEPNKYAGYLIRLYLITRARKGELMQAKWQDIHWRHAVLKTPERKVMLTEQALDTLRNIPRQSDNPYIFCGHKPGRPLVNISRPWQRIRKAAGMEWLRLDDLRRQPDELIIL